MVASALYMSNYNAECQCNSEKDSGLWTREVILEHVAVVPGLLALACEAVPRAAYNE